MELKFAYPSAEAACLHSFNRTFMELKYVAELQYVVKAEVLIVPLWN